MLKSMRNLLICTLFCQAGLAATAAEGEPSAQKARAVLAKHCYRCHGQDGRNEGGLNVVTDLNKLRERRLVLPGDPKRSKLLKRVVSGEMPPESDDGKDGAVLAPPTPEEVSALRDWVAAGAPVDGEKAARQFISDEEVVKAIAADLTKAGPRERRFIRYFTLVHLHNADYNDDQIQTYRVALSKLVNSLSWNRKIKPPTPIDPARVILRIDLRDYLWDNTTWQSVVDQYPYSLGAAGEASRTVAELSGCEQPKVRADWFVYAASRPPLYHDVLRLPATIDELERKIDVDVSANIKQDRVARAGFSTSGVSRHNRLIERHESTNGGYWRSYDFGGSADRRNLFAHPLGPFSGADDFEHDGGEAIFALPNGLQGYMLMDGKGRRIDKGPLEIVRDNKQADAAVVNGISCMSCHNAGLIEKADQVREVVEKTGAFSKEMSETILTLYPPRDAMDDLLRRDAERFARAVAETGAALSRTEPVFALARQFEEDVSLTLAAAEAGLKPEEFRAVLAGAPRIGQALGPFIVGGSVKRDTFVDAFPAIVEARHLAMAEAEAKAKEKEMAKAEARENVKEMARPGRPEVGRGRWAILFRGGDPRAWNTRSTGDCTAIPLTEAPAGLQYLRLTRLDTGETLIIPMTRDRLMTGASARDEGQPFRWSGANSNSWGGYHLGVIEGPRISGFNDSGRGKLSVQVDGIDNYLGSGFGHRVHGNPQEQGFGWRGRCIAPTDFEIAVSPGPLTSREKAILEAQGFSPERVAATPNGPAGISAGFQSFQPVGNRKTIPADQLVDIPSDLHSPHADGYRDAAPIGGMLVGFKVGPVSQDGHARVISLQPIYRVGRAELIGDRVGGVPREEVTVLARPGYAVGGWSARSGLWVDAIQLHFMKLAGDHLDPNDSYSSPWYGGGGGGESTHKSDGKLVVGIQGRRMGGGEIHWFGMTSLKPRGTSR